MNRRERALAGFAIGASTVVNFWGLAMSANRGWSLFVVIFLALLVANATLYFAYRIVSRGG